MFGRVLNTSLVFFLTEAAQMCIYEQVFWKYPAKLLHIFRTPFYKNASGGAASVLK